MGWTTVLWHRLWSGGLFASGSERLSLWAQLPPLGPRGGNEAPSVEVSFLVGGLRGLAAALVEWQAKGGGLTLLSIGGHIEGHSFTSLFVVK